MFHSTVVGYSGGQQVCVVLIGRVYQYLIGVFVYYLPISIHLPISMYVCRLKWTSYNIPAMAGSLAMMCLGWCLLYGCVCSSSNSASGSASGWNWSNWSVYDWCYWLSWGVVLLHSLSLFSNSFILQVGIWRSVYLSVGVYLYSHTSIHLYIYI